MTLREFKVWGGKRKEKDSLYIWAKDADDAIGIARLTDQSICTSQWTGNEKSYEEQLDWLYRLRSEIYVYMPKEWLIPMNNALDIAIQALEQKPCDDAISRKSMLDYLNYLHGEMPEEEFVKALPSVIPTCIETVTEFADRCRECGKQKTKWIPVSEKLPENKTYVLTTIKVPNRIAHTRSGWYEGGFFHNDNGDVWRATDMEVIAWMPLPEPYKAGSEE